MDDCNLQKLSVKPGKISPVFNQNTIDYSVTVGSNVEKITLDCLTSDNGASCCISGGDGGRTVALTEGQVNDIKIEVTAEDGTAKSYTVHAHRLSASDATLSDLRISKGKISPEFVPSLTEYSCTLPCDLSSLCVTPCVPDVKAAVTVNGVKPGGDVALNISQTVIDLAVTSVDGSNTQVYKLNVYKKQIPRYVKLADAALAVKYECPVSLSPLFQPITIKDSEPRHTYSGPIIDQLTKTSKIDPLSELPLCNDWRIEDLDLDKEMSDAQAYIPLSGGGSCETVKMSELGTKVVTCNEMPKLEEREVKYEMNAPVKHSVEIRSWEKQLQQIFDESNATKLCESAEKCLKQYYTSLPTGGSTRPSYREGESPLDYLEHAAHCYATAIKNKPKDAVTHLKLGLVLEERYYVEDMYGIHKTGEGGSSKAGANHDAKESSKAEECIAICQLRGVGAGSPLSLQLKAIDEEYHHLKNSGQHGAEHVQALYAWKSKQATQEGAAAQKASDEESPLGQAYLKCMDALALDESKAIYHFHVGRLLTIRGDFNDAVLRLEAALSWNNKHQMAKFYLGLGLTLKKDGPGIRTKEAAGYIMETMECLLQHQTEQSMSVDSTPQVELHAEDLLRSSNVHLLRGFIQLGKILKKNTDIKNMMSSTDIFHTAALLSSQLFPLIHKGDTYQQIEWVLLEAHSQLLEHLVLTQPTNIHLIAQRCQRLLALIKHSTIPQSTDLLALQLKTCEMFVQIQPCSSHALYLLGSAQLAHYDNNAQTPDSAQLLDDAKRSFRCSISIEGQPATGEAPDDVKEQKWWRVKEEEKEKRRKEEEAAKAPSVPAKSGRGGPAGRGGPTVRGAAAARGAPSRGGTTARGTARGAPANRGRGASTPPRGGATSRGGAAKPATGGAAASKPAVSKAPAASTSSKPCLANKPGSAKRPSSANKQSPPAKSDASVPAATASTQAGPVNKKSYHPRLGLARALSKTPETISEALQLYDQVVDLAPKLHDGYIESAELVLHSDPLAALEIYCKFPESSDPTFDDAYIFGEIVRLLMKHEKYDDPRLGPNMISLGRVIGIANLEKYVDILDSKFKSGLLKQVYAGVNRKAVDNPDMQVFFKFKLWI